MQGAGVSALELWQDGPAVQQSGHQRAIQTVKPETELREILLQAVGETLNLLDLLLDELATLFDQELEEAGCGGVGLPGTETLPVVEQDLQQQAGVAGIVFGAGWEEGLAVGGGHGRGDRVNHEVGVFGKQVDDRAAFLFNGDGDGTSGEALAQGHSPKLSGFRGIVESAGFRRPTIAGCQRPEMFSGSPVDGRKSSPIRLGS